MMNVQGRLGSLVLLGLLTTAAAALAAPQSTSQQRCLNNLTKAGADVVKHQGKSNWKCVRNATRGKVDNLGDPGETLTAQACLTNDVHGKVAKKHQKTVDRDAAYCQGASTPGFAYIGPASINTAASTASRAIVAEIFGSNLDAAVVDDAVDSDGARCQQEALKGANRIVDDMWRVVRDGVSDGLSGRARRSGAAPDLPAQTSDNLQSEILAHAFDDPQGKIQYEINRLHDKMTLRCGAAITSLAGMFPGSCSAAATITAMADCIAGIARGQFYGSVGGLYGITVECDLTDDGTANESCVSAARSRHLLDRTAYGPDSYTIGRLTALGPNAYIDEQLDPSAIDDSSVDATIATTYPSLALSVVEVRDCYPQGGGGTCPGHPGGNKNDVWRQMERSEIYRATASHRQLEAMLVDFWFNHFSVTGSAGQQKWNTPSYLRDSIRPYITANFEEMVVRMARGPAMLDYLDQRQNQVGVPPGTGYNENFPREMLELHTMGVTGPYTETDVKEVARALTGWREEWNNEANFEPGYPGFRYQNTRHDFLGPKTVLGQVINFPADGKLEGATAISLAAKHPHTATFICTKLVRRFVDEAAPYRLIDACAVTFLAAQNDADQVKQVVALILKSREMQLYPEYRHSKVKRPVLLLPSLLRAVGANPSPASLDYDDIRVDVGDLGERIRNADPPTGYPEDSGFWASPGGLVQRFNLVESMARTYAASWGVSGTGTNTETVDGVIAVLFPIDGVSPSTRAAAIAYLDSIAAPAADKVEQAGAFLLSSADFLTH